MTGFYPVYNNVATTTTGYTAGSGSLPLASGAGASFGSTFPIVFSTFTVAGILKTPQGVYSCTGRTGDTLTGLTLKWGTDTSLPAGCAVEIRWCAEHAAQIATAINALETTTAGYGDIVTHDAAEFAAAGSIPNDLADLAIADPAAQRTRLELGDAAIHATSDFDAAGAAASVLTALTTFEARTDNPHQVTASQVGAYTTAEMDDRLAAKADTSALAGYQPVDSDLTALAGLSATGIGVRTGTGAWSARTITGTANQVVVTNGDGVAGNPTLSLPQSIDATASPTFAGLTLNSNPGMIRFPALTGYAPHDIRRYWKMFGSAEDPILSVGYNPQYADGTNPLSTEPEWTTNWEAYYDDGSGQPKMEWYTQYRSPDGTVRRRPFFCQANRTTNTIEYAIASASIFQVTANDGVTVRLQVDSTGVTTGGNLKVPSGSALTGVNLGDVVAVGASGRTATGAGRNVYTAGASGASGSHQFVGGVDTTRLIFVQVPNANAEGIVLVGAASQAKDYLAAYTSGGSLRWRVDKNGTLMVKQNTAPADADINIGEVAIWFDSSSGAAKVNFKGKDNGGTIRTATVALA